MIREKNPPRIVIAKFTPDVFRNEPRNIGLILWVDGVFYSRFLDEPAFVPKDIDYARWVSYWQDSVSGSSIQPMTGDPIPITEPECVDGLFSTQSDTFTLSDVGSVVDRVTPRNAPKVLDSLFSELVEVRERTPSEVAVSLERASDKVLEKSGLKGSPGFRKRYDFTGPRVWSPETYAIPLRHRERKHSVCGGAESER